MHVAPEAAVEQLAHGPDLPREVDGLGPERLPPRKRQELAGQSGAAFGGLAHAVHEAPAPRRVGLPIQHLEAAGDHHQQIVEVVRHAPGELTDRLDLLGLPQALLDPGPFRHLPLQLTVRLLELPGAGDHEGLQLLGRLLTGLQQGADLILALARPHGGLDRARQRDRLHRPLQQRDVAQGGQQALTPGGDGRLILSAGQHHERQIRPRGLALHESEQGRQILAEQPLLGDEHRRRTRRDAFDQLRQRGTDLGRQAAAAEQVRGGGGIPPDRRVDENA